MGADIESKSPTTAVVCYFCDRHMHPLVQSDRYEHPIVRASDETPKQAQKRPVCAECHPRMEWTDDE